MHWLVIQLGTTTLAALNSIIDKYLAGDKQVHPSLYLASFGIVSLPSALLGVTGIIPWPVFSDLGLSFLSGICFSLAVILYYRTVALDGTEISRLTPLLRLSPVFVLLLSTLIFGERLYLRQYFAFIAMLAGSSLLAIKVEQGQFCVRQGILPMLVVSILLAVNSTLTAQLYHRYSLLTAFVAKQTGMTIGSAILFFLLPSTRQLFRQKPSLSPHLCSVVIGEQIGRQLTSFLSAYVLTQIGSAALTSAMGGLRPFFVLLLAHWLLGEPLEHRSLHLKILGLGCMSIGMVLLAI
jgi:drug/metabolite transporter (DMT)-like permease